ncbi:hypothetical protein C8J56DRAFT_1015968 [Mycena floridula]|nr:hypothetical protein C8J56DRAFT_1015968 [Mycena floridula]
MGTSYELKGKAKKFISKMFDLEYPQGGPGPAAESEHRPAQAQSQPQSYPQMLHSFDALKLKVESDPGPDFVGGFHPNPTSRPPGHLPRPPAMPVAYAPQSLTMQYALGPPQLHSRPNSAPDVTNFGIIPGSSAPSTPAKFPGQIHVPSTPPKRARASSTPPSPANSTAANQTQCAGVTKSGKRCTRLVKTGGPALVGLYSDDEEIERFCFQHQKEVLEPTGFYVRKQSGGTGDWVDFVDFIPSYLHLSTQAALRVEMEKLRSKGDEEGWIYCFEIKEDTSSKSSTKSAPLLLKVGRTVNLVKRLHQWGKQCGSKEQVLRGWFPAEEGEDSSLLKGRVQAEGKGVWCHRLERLIHLELADLAVNTPYLEPGWKNFRKGKGKGRAQQAQYTPAVPSSPPVTGSPRGRPRKGSAASGTNSGTTSPRKPPFLVNGLGNYNAGPCIDCGSFHKEIFSFPRVQSGAYKGREWDDIVKGVIEGWGKFVEEYV